MTQSMAGSFASGPVARQNMLGSIGGSKLLTHDNQEGRKERRGLRVPMSPSRVHALNSLH